MQSDPQDSEIRDRDLDDPSPHGLVAGIIDFSARTPFLIILVTIGLGIWGWLSLQRVPLDAIPDLSDAQVIVYTEWPGRSPDLVEAQVTYPLTATLLAAPQVRVVRGQSFFGVSFVYVIFEDGTDIYWARSRVLETLNTTTSKLPEGVKPAIGPDATGVGWVFEYALVDESGRHDLAELRSLQDWNLRFALAAIPGVAEVAPIGGFVRQYQVLINPNKLVGYRLTLGEVAEAVRRSSSDVGGEVLEMAGHEQMIRGRGTIQNKSDLEGIPLKLGENGVPVYLRDVAEVALGPAPRRGIAELDGRGETVGAIVVMRYGQNALDVIDAVKARLTELERTLPEGVKIVVTYDRSELIREAIATVRDALIQELMVVSLIIIVFLLHVRSALVPILTLPVAVLMAFIPMAMQGITANIMSLGGIVVAIGAMVDASMVIVENVHKKLEDWHAGGRAGSRHDVVIGAMKEVGPSIFHSLLVIMLGFVPVFALEGTEGRLFKPLAYTKSYSMGMAALLAITITPALVVLLVRGRILPEHRHPLSRLLVAMYTPLVRLVVRHRYAVIGLAALAMVFTVPAYLRLGTEFMPPLNEGTILYMPTAPPGVSATEAASILQSMDQRLRQFPEVERVFGKIGRADTATDPAPMSMVETVVLLKPKSEWRDGMTWDRLIAEMDQSLQYPGMPNIWWMPVQTRIEMLSTGIRSQLGIKVHGPDLASIERAAVDIERAMAAMPGVRSAFAERNTGGFFLDFKVRRHEAARYGLRAGDVNEAIAMAIGGMDVAETIEGRERYAINVRYAREFREDLDALRRVLVATPTGAQVPLGQLADVAFTTGPHMVATEGGTLVGTVFVDLSSDVPVADFVESAKEIVSREVQLPRGVRLDWAGQFQYFERAKEKLKIVVPMTLLVICLLLYLNTRSMTETLIVLLAVPFSLIGAVWLLYLLDYNISVAVWVGIIALAGVDAETGVVMLLYLKLTWRERARSGKLRTFADLTDAIVEGAAKRIRPKLMTVLTDFIGLMPVLVATGTGADLMKRIAAPMVGGLFTSFLLELTVYPAIFAIWKGRRLPRA